MESGFNNIFHLISIPHLFFSLNESNTCVDSAEKFQRKSPFPLSPTPDVTALNCYLKKKKFRLISELKNTTYILIFLSALNSVCCLTFY